jgi:hypothetical protein
MRRWHSRLAREIAAEAREGSLSAWPHDLWDTAMAFFQSAYHLKDWLLHDHPEHGLQVERTISTNSTLSLCADICNGTKHRRLIRRSRVAAHLVGLREFAPEIPSQARWLIAGSEAPVRVDELAAEVVTAWESLLRSLPGLEWQPAASEQPERG